VPSTRTTAGRIERLASKLPGRHFLSCPAFGEPDVAEKAQLIFAISGGAPPPRQMPYFYCATPADLPAIAAPTLQTTAPGASRPTFSSLPSVVRCVRASFSRTPRIRLLIDVRFDSRPLQVMDLGSNPERAASFKLVGNTMILGVLELLAESMTLADQSGVGKGARDVPLSDSACIPLTDQAS
jgi:hypothetical protein